MLKIGIISLSVREGRNAVAVSKWVLEQSKKRKDAEFELVDLYDYKLPLLGLTPTAQEGKTIKAWQDKMASFDAYIFVTPEYNHSYPGAFKNASDYLKPELQNKVVGYVGYGGLGGIRAIEAHRLVAAEQGLASVQRTVNFMLMSDFVDFAEFKPAAYHEPIAQEMFDQVILWGNALKTVR
ncbi:NADPH-dependent FMN reductase [Alteracholeplasma palmae J233]|uniref:NADPH-dependent FMN reductase n=1 Tax=Alteracholeplasma palmae (strain ATCC 49389 / J233) TaxID=1318466 RepID=U4KK15_ALTPJ|nr:NAD(P)H-dependent oxidoreductase [Alteracholeplasma palmae]CCV63939.1 NADPH-dependent FMN reductase [Alteracholeplasma palmae J233]